ncbi:hypothetical protein ACAW68_04805 [Weissella confusa]|uniref:hypothetical protein n=1 Tax=Weissella confusa TaxID=1583 RepID=UPI0035A26604
MIVTVNFADPQVRPENGPVGIEISQVIMPYSIHNTEDPSQYLGGQTVLTKADGVTLADNTADWNKLALAKIKNMVAASDIYVPDPIIGVPEGLPASSAVEAPVSSAPTQVTTTTKV